MTFIPLHRLCVDIDWGKTMGIYRRAFHRIGYELDQMREYVLTVSGALRTVHERHVKEIRERAKWMDPDEAQELYNDSAEDDISLGDLFPALSASSTLVAIMSFLEHQLVYICREVESARTGKPSSFKPKNPVLKNCVDHLGKYGITVSMANPECAAVTNLQETRNAIVHQLGELDYDEVTQKKDRGFKVYSFLNGRSDAKVIEQHLEGPLKIVLTHPFCLEAIEGVRNFLNQIVALVPKGLYSTLNDERDR
ncbi:MAG: hypothetical protein JWP89_3371 [Schlesneria sp.]|nr:hypothetical protein [Schlesneria sp.]